MIISFCWALSLVGGVSLGWDPSARSERDGARRGRKIFQRKNTCDTHLPNEAERLGSKENCKTNKYTGP